MPKNVPRQEIRNRQKTAREYCLTHPPKKKIIELCCVDGCYEECDSFSFCNKHYQEWLSYGKIRSPEDIASLPGECWKDVAGYEGLYRVSNLGRVFSVPRLSARTRGNSTTTIRVKAKIMKWDVDCKGYARVTLSKNGRTHSVLVHRLVAGAFIPNPKNFPQVNHIDCNPSNNAVENLEWCNQSMQEKHKLFVAGVMNSSLLCQPIPIRNIETGQEYHSISGASKSAKIPIHVLIHRLKTGKPDSNGHHWTYVVK